MLRQLLESRPARHRTRSAAVVSLVVHVALAGTAIAATATTVLPEPEPTVVKEIVYIPTPTPRVRPRPQPAAPAKPAAPQAPSTVPRLETPIDVPSTLPPIDPTATPTVEPEHGTFVPSGPAGTGDAPTGTSGGTDEPYWFEDVERAAAPIGRQRAPRYPEALRSARVEGGVTVRFVVDTLGRVEPASIRITESTHALFEPAVQAALLQTRFRPARVRGGPVRQLVQQRFVFALTR